MSDKRTTGEKEVSICHFNRNVPIINLNSRSASEIEVFEARESKGE